MNLKNIYYIALYCLLAVGTTSCGDNNDDYIPPALDEPEQPEDPSDSDYNKPEFTPHKDGEPFNTYRGLVMTGYQGWFGTPTDGCEHGNQWYHYQEQGRFKPGVLNNSIDFWPDMREYEKKYETDFTLPNKEKATVYSAYDESAVLLHFKWMKDYGIDGAFMQRFVGEVIDNPAGKHHFDKVLEHAMKGSNASQRAICVMYDLGGFMSAPTRNTAAVLADAQSIMDKYQLKDRTKQKFYLYQNDKPMIVLWGVGFNDGRPYSPEDIKALMDGLKAQGYSLMLGVPTHWREGRNDALPVAMLHPLIKEADVIMPWFVGRYGSESYANFHDLIQKDIAWCKDEAHKVEYAPLCFPGSSDRNMQPNHTINSRYGGQFLWDQMYHCIKSGAQMLYIAMFDEIDEGTAIYKCLNQKDVPDNNAPEDYWVVYKNVNGSESYTKSSTEVTGLTSPSWCKKASELGVTFMGIENGLPTDHYLWLTGEGKKMLRGEIPMTATLPVRK